MLFSFAILIIMTGFGFGFDDDDFSLSGLTQEAHDNVTVISSSDEKNYDGLLECAHKLAGEIAMEGGIQGGVKPGVEPGVLNMPISGTADSALILSNNMASSLSHSQQSNDVS